MDRILKLFITVMKKLALVFILIFTVSCEPEEIASIDERIQGEWVWLQSYGGIDGRTETPESTNTAITLEIVNNSLKRFNNGNLETEKTFLIVRGSSIYGEGEKDLLDYGAGVRQAVEVNGNRLFLRDECYDCFQHEYIKK